MPNKLIGEDVPHVISDGIGLCYFDPKTEKLIEFHQGITLSVGPFESSVRRYYLVKPSATINGQHALYANINIQGSVKDVEIKTRLGGDRISYKEDFDSSIDGDPTRVFFNLYPSGIAPIDVLIQSNTNERTNTEISITLEVF